MSSVQLACAEAGDLSTGPYQTRVHTEGQWQTEAAAHLNLEGSGPHDSSWSRSSKPDLPSELHASRPEAKRPTGGGRGGRVAVSPPSGSCGRRPPALAHALATVLRASLTAFDRSRLSISFPGRRMTALGPRPSRPLPSRGGFQPGFGVSTSKLDHGLRSPARPRPGDSGFPGRDHLLVPDRDRGLNSHRVSLRRSPDCFKRIRSRGRKRAAKGSCH